MARPPKLPELESLILAAAMEQLMKAKQGEFEELLGGIGWRIDLKEEGGEPCAIAADVLEESGNWPPLRNKLREMTVNYLRSTPDRKSTLAGPEGYSAEQQMRQRALYNGLKLAGELGPNGMLTEELDAIYQARALAGQYDGKELTQPLAEGMIANQVDDRWSNVWRYLLEGQADPLLKGSRPGVGFDGLVKMPSRLGSNEPDKGAIGGAVRDMAYLLIAREKENDRPSAAVLGSALDQLLVKIERAWPNENWKSEFSVLADAYEWAPEMVRAVEQHGKPKTRSQPASVAAGGLPEKTTEVKGKTRGRVVTEAPPPPHKDVM